MPLDDSFLGVLVTLLRPSNKPAILQYAFMRTRVCMCVLCSELGACVSLCLRRAVTCLCAQMSKKESSVHGGSDRKCSNRGRRAAKPCSDIAQVRTSLGCFDLSIDRRFAIARLFVCVFVCLCLCLCLCLCPLTFLPVCLRSCKS